MFHYIPEGSAVAVQQDDSRPWTHRTVVGSANYNHHGGSYIIQVTINGRCITWNRWHIKPTTVTADAYLKHHSHKQCHIATDPLAEILSNITKNLEPYAAKHTTSDKNQSDTKQKEAAKDNEHHSMEASNTTKQPFTQAVKNNRTIIEDGDAIRIRSVCISKKPDRLEYR